MISALASKKRSNQKNKLIGGFYFDYYTAFLFDLFLEAREEILEKNLLGFLEDLKTPKWHFEINWPLEVLHPRMENLYVE